MQERKCISNYFQCYSTLLSLSVAPCLSHFQKATIDEENSLDTTTIILFASFHSSCYVFFDYYMPYTNFSKNPAPKYWGHLARDRHLRVVIYSAGQKMGQMVPKKQWPPFLVGCPKMSLIQSVKTMEMETTSRCPLYTNSMEKWSIDVPFSNLFSKLVMIGVVSRQFIGVFTPQY